jgi:homopolymeric O-antigen transport system ATP-binding protein
MADTVLELDRVSKKFRRGEINNSLRDLLPALMSRLVRRDRAQGPDQRDFWALRDVSLHVRRGEAFGVIGANGAGKSTILKLLTGIMRPTSGSVRVKGRVSAVIEITAGFHQDLTGRENIFLNGAILGMTREEIRRRFDEIVAFSGLEDFIDTPVKRYSSGMYARLGFSVAAHVNPDILIVDEVLSVGDYLFQRKCVERMHAVISGGATVIFVSHDLQAVASLCTRSALLERGRVKLIGPTEEVIRAYYGASHEQRVVDDDGGVHITEVTTHDETGPRVKFTSGGKMRITVRARAGTPHDDMSVVIQVVDERQYPLFDTCAQRLGASAIALDREQTVTCTFEVDLALAEGTYHVNAFLFRYVTDRAYDSWLTAATFFVTGAPEIKGVINLHPRLVGCRIESELTSKTALEAPVACQE